MTRRSPSQGNLKGEQFLQKEKGEKEPPLWLMVCISLEIWARLGEDWCQIVSVLFFWEFDLC